MIRLIVCLDSAWSITRSTMKINARNCKDFVRILFSPGLWFDVYWPASRKYWFSLLLIGVIGAKVLHIYSHLNSLSLGQFLLWGPTFFLQDLACILIVLTLCKKFYQRWVRVVMALVVIPARYSSRSIV